MGAAIANSYVIAVDMDGDEVLLMNVQELVTSLRISLSRY